jgi:hypothetical protein
MTDDGRILSHERAGKQEEGKAEVRSQNPEARIKGGSRSSSDFLFF